MPLQKELPLQRSVDITINWKLAARLKNADGKISTGFAGAINGVYDDALIVAGGANFPDKLPWEGGKKHYSNEVHILLRDGKQYKWQAGSALNLPEPIAYCGNVVTPYGIVYAGGENDQGLSKKAWLIKWHHQTGKFTIDPLPDLPVAITNVALAYINDVVYAIGGDELNRSSAGFYRINIKDSHPQWQVSPALPVALANSVAVAQPHKSGATVYVIGGRTKTAKGISELQHTNFVFNTVDNKWKECVNISDGKKVMNFSAAAGVSLNNRFILLTGGDDGLIFHQIEVYLARIAKAETDEEKEKLTTEKNLLNTNHQGFNKSVLLYDTYTDRWTKISDLPFAAHVTTTATKWGSDIVLSNGEIKPGVRTPDVMIGKINLIANDGE